MFIRSFITAFIVFLLIDALWLGLISRKLYKKELGHLMTPKPMWAAAVIFYLLYIAGLVFFVIQPAIDINSSSDALLRGAFFGLIAYGTYDLTNQTTLKNWPVKITILDLLWGSFISGITAFICYHLNGI